MSETGTSIFVCVSVSVCLIRSTELNQLRIPLLRSRKGVLPNCWLQFRNKQIYLIWNKTVYIFLRFRIPGAGEYVRKSSAVVWKAILHTCCLHSDTCSRSVRLRVGLMTFWRLRQHLPHPCDFQHLSRMCVSVLSILFSVDGLNIHSVFDALLWCSSNVTMGHTLTTWLCAQTHSHLQINKLQFCLSHSVGRGGKCPCLGYPSADTF